MLRDDTHLLLWNFDYNDNKLSKVQTLPTILKNNKNVNKVMFI